LTEDITAADKAGIKVVKSQIKVSNVYSAFNACEDKVVGNVSEVTFNMNSIPTESLSVDDETYTYLALNYLLVGDKDTEKSLTNVEFTWETEDGKTNSPVTTFKDVPVQRNYRTNIIGYLLTNPADFNIEIDATFDGNKNVTINEQAVPVDDLQTLLENNKNEIKAITYKVVGESANSNTEIAFSIPAGTKSEGLTFDFTEITLSKINKICINDNGTYGKSVTIVIPEGIDLKILTINLPNSHVELKQGSYSSVVASTSSSTLVVPKGVTIGKLKL
jgi:hypothetical protein